MKNELEAAWQDVVQAYRSSRINSERSMQAVLYKSLSAKLSSEHVILCEPSINLAGGAVLPDLIVASGNLVQAVLELKFVPYHYPTIEDLDKLTKYGASKASFPLLINPDTGAFSEQLFTFSPDCLLVFAVIGQHDSKAFDQDYIQVKMASLEPRFVHLCLKVAPQI